MAISSSLPRVKCRQDAEQGAWASEEEEEVSLPHEAIAVSVSTARGAEMLHAELQDSAEALTRLMPCTTARLVALNGVPSSPLNRPESLISGAAALPVALPVAPAVSTVSAIANGVHMLCCEPI